MQWDSTQIKLPGDEEEDCHNFYDDDGHDVDDDEDGDDNDEGSGCIPMVPLGTNSAASFPGHYTLRTKSCSNVYKGVNPSTTVGFVLRAIFESHQTCHCSDPGFQSQNRGIVAEHIITHLKGDRNQN